MWNPRPLPELLGDKQGLLDEVGWIVWVLAVVGVVLWL